MATHTLSRSEFIALLAMLSATVAFSIDAMLPALPDIGTELSPTEPNRAQLIILSFVIGLGAATFFVGPLSDAFGRKPVILSGAGLYIIGAALAWASQGLEWMLLARVIQGIGAAGPRIAAMAIVRDLYSGREMARIMSFTMMVFTLVPAAAPLIGSWIIALSGWRAIFLSFIVFAFIAALWLGLRQPESLPVENRRPLRLHLMRDALVEMLKHPVVRLALATQTMSYVVLFLTISLVQPVFDQSFGEAQSFPFWFAIVSLISALSSVLNATLVMRLGMRKLATVAYGAQVVLSLGLAAAWVVMPEQDIMFAIFIGWLAGVFFMTGLTIGNLNAIIMEPMGHVAGMAASVSGSVATILGALLAAPIGQTFNGTPLPLSLGVAGSCMAAFVLLLVMRRIEAHM